jgi:hypothetical protein
MRRCCSPRAKRPPFCCFWRCIHLRDAAPLRLPFRLTRALHVSQVLTLDPRSQSAPGFEAQPAESSTLPALRARKVSVPHFWCSACSCQPADALRAGHERQRSRAGARVCRARC